MASIWSILPAALMVPRMFRFGVFLGISPWLAIWTHIYLAEAFRPLMTFQKVATDNVLPSIITVTATNTVACVHMCSKHEACVGVNTKDGENGTYCEFTRHLIDVEDLEERIGWKHYMLTPQEDCTTYYSMGKRINGEYMLNVGFPEAKMAYCQLDTLPGFTVIQLRQPAENQTNFNRSWAEYRDGFGDPKSGYWFGNEAVYRMTAKRRQRLILYAVSFAGGLFSKSYRDFRIKDENSKYEAAFIRMATGTCLHYHHGRKFSTYDADHTTNNCPATHASGFWFNECGGAFINGIYRNQTEPFQTSSIYLTCYGNNVLAMTALLMRPQ